MSLRTRYKESTDNIFARPKKEESSKLIFISCEGPITEEIYFMDIVSEIFADIKDKIKIASVREDFFSIPPENRTQSDINQQNKSSPKQVLQRMNDYLKDKKYWDSENNPDDEFWLVMDVDDHTSESKIDEWRYVLNQAKTKNYKCAISNPFFELWLLLHHNNVTEEDKKYAVTNEHKYESTKHFSDRLKNDCFVPLKNNKEPQKEHYTKGKIIDAINRAKSLNFNCNEGWPDNLGTTVYILLEKIIELDKQTK